MGALAEFSGSNSDMGYSGSIWQDCPVDALRNKEPTGPLGFLWEKNFDTIPITPPTTEGNWGEMAAFSSTGGTITASTLEIGGGAVFASDGDNEGASTRSVVAPVKINLNNGDFWMEWRQATDTIADTKNGIVSGLMANVALTATSPIAADGTIADVNMVGFWRREGDGDYLDAIYRADGQTMGVAQADAVQIAADTYVNLGLKFVPKRNIGNGPGYLYWYANGAVVASYLVTSTAGNPFPNDVYLGFVFAILNATASTPGSATIKYVRMAQLATAYP